MMAGDPRAFIDSLEVHDITSRSALPTPPNIE